MQLIRTQVFRILLPNGGRSAFNFFEWGLKICVLFLLCLVPLRLASMTELYRIINNQQENHSIRNCPSQAERAPEQ